MAPSTKNCPSSDWKQTKGLTASTAEIWRFKNCKSRVVCKNKKQKDFGVNVPVDFQWCESKDAGGNGGSPPAAPSTSSGTCSITFPSYDKVKLTCNEAFSVFVNAPNGFNQTISLPAGEHTQDLGSNTIGSGVKYVMKSAATGKELARAVSAPAPIDCSKGEGAPYECNKAIDVKHNLGSPTQRVDWVACKSFCNSDSDCQGWTFESNSLMCQKKKKYADLVSADKRYSGKRSPGSSGGGSDGTAAGGTTTTTTTSPPSTPDTTTTTSSSTGWWNQTSGVFGLTNTMLVGIGAAVVLLMVCACAASMMMMSSSN